MKIAICASVHAATKVMEVKEALEKASHQVIIPRNFDKFVTGEMKIIPDTTPEEIAKYKIQGGLLRGYWEVIRGVDAILVVNEARIDPEHDFYCQSYIGGNTFLEMGFAYILGRIIFLLNSVPNLTIIKEEILAMDPIKLYGDLAKINEVKIVGTVYDLIRDAVFACEKVGLVADDEVRVYSRVLGHIGGVSNLFPAEIIRSIVYQAPTLGKNNFVGIKRYIIEARLAIEDNLAQCLKLPKDWRDSEVEVAKLMTMIKERQTLADAGTTSHMLRLNDVEQIDILRAIENRLEQLMKEE